MRRADVVLSNMGKHSCTKVMGICVYGCLHEGLRAYVRPGGRLFMYGKSVGVCASLKCGYGRSCVRLERVFAYRVVFTGIRVHACLCTRLCAQRR